MDLQTEDAVDKPGQNFLVARYSRDIFQRSQIGGIFINKEASSGGQFNRTYATDIRLSITPSLTIDGFLAGTSSRGVFHRFSRSMLLPPSKPGRSGPGSKLA